MNEAKGHICPQCGAPRAADGSPSCACTQRASDALRDARTAEAAAAEDFDPLRIRPYVELDGTPQEQSPAPVAPEGETQRLPAVEETMLLRAVTPSPAAPAPQEETSVLPTPTDLSLFAGGGSGAGTPEHPTAGEDPRAAATAARSSSPSREPSWRWPRWRVSRAACSRTRHRPGTRRPPGRPGKRPDAIEELGAGNTVRDRLHIRTAHVGVPDPVPQRAPVTDGVVDPVGHGVQLRERRQDPTPTATASTAAATNRQSSSTPNPVLQRGDEGPEVTELQLRLTQLRLYTGPDNGIFDKQVQTSIRTYQLARGITSDTLGVYGTATRASLESETTEP